MRVKVDLPVEERAFRESGALGRGGGMGNALFAIDVTQLPIEAASVVQQILAGGPFQFPGRDGTAFGNRFKDLPPGRYLEFTVPTPGLHNDGSRGRGARRLVVRHNGILFFTACHYERVDGVPAAGRAAATLTVDPEWRNGFYVITGLSLSQRERLRTAVTRLWKESP